MVAITTTTARSPISPIERYYDLGRLKDRLAAGNSLKNVNVTSPRFSNYFCRQGRSWRRFVPLESFQEVPNVLLVKAVLLLAGDVLIPWPETRAVRGKDLVYEDYLAPVQSKFKLCVSKDDARTLADRRRLLKNGERCNSACFG